MAIVGEDLVGETLAGQVFGTVGEDLMVLGPQLHWCGRWLVEPVFVVDKGLLQGGHLFGGEGSAAGAGIGVLVVEAH